MLTTMPPTSENPTPPASIHSRMNYQSASARDNARNEAAYDAGVDQHQRSCAVTVGQRANDEANKPDDNSGGRCPEGVFRGGPVEVLGDRSQKDAGDAAASAHPDELSDDRADDDPPAPEDTVTALAC